MEPSTWAVRRVKYGGLGIAFIGFLLTRFTVLASTRTDESLLRFVLGDLLALVFGLLLVVFGLGLSVSTYRREYVNLVAFWCVLGTAVMSAITVLSFLEGELYGDQSMLAIWTHGFVANVLLGGALGGVFIGIRSASNRRHRETLARQADQVTVLNRLLRHEVLNKINVIQSHVDLLDSTDTNAASPGAIRRSAEKIDATIQSVGFLSRSTSRQEPVVESIDLGPALRAEVEAARERYPNADVRVEGSVPDGLWVQANSQVGTVFEQLFENAIEHNDAETPTLTVSVTADVGVAVRIVDDGPGLPPTQHSLLAHGDLPEYDDPTTGFGLTMSRLLCDQYGADIDAETVPGERGTTITVSFLGLPDGETDVDVWTSQHGVAPAALATAAVASLVAGVVMGEVLQVTTGSLAIIGALYGVPTMAVGWTTHLFHSAVFGMGFVVLLSTRPTTARSRAKCAVFGAVYGVSLWLFAAGIVMPIWLRAVGVAAPIPMLGLSSLAGHVVWGFILGGVYAVLSERGPGLPSG